VPPRVSPASAIKPDPDLVVVPLSDEEKLCEDPSFPRMTLCTVWGDIRMGYLLQNKDGIPQVVAPATYCDFIVALPNCDGGELAVRRVWNPELGLTSDKSTRNLSREFAEANVPGSLAKGSKGSKVSTATKALRIFKSFGPEIDSAAGLFLDKAQATAMIRRGALNRTPVKVEILNADASDPEETQPDSPALTLDEAEGLGRNAAPGAFELFAAGEGDASHARSTEQVSCRPYTALAA